MGWQVLQEEVSWCLALQAVDGVPEPGVLRGAEESEGRKHAQLFRTARRAVLWGGMLRPLHNRFCSPICSLAWQCRAAGSLLSPSDPGLAQWTSGGSCHSAVGARSALLVLLSTLYSVRPMPDLLLPLWPQCLAHSTSLPTDSGTRLLPFEAFVPISLN